jgi:flagellar biosynthetic protein FliR
MEDGQAHPALATLFMVTATALFFAGDQHVAVIAALADSYGAMPPGSGFVPRIGLSEVVDQLSETFFIALRLSSPFLILSLVLNFAIGVVNKLVPQIPVFFIAMPFVTAAGLFLLFEVMQEMMAGFLGAFAAWLAGG